MSEHRALTRVDIAADHPAFAGHFPGRPVLPGVALLAEVIEAALARAARWRLRSAAAPRLAVVKFLAPVGPGARSCIALARSADERSHSADRRRKPHRRRRPDRARRPRRSSAHEDRERRRRRTQWTRQRERSNLLAAAAMRWLALAAGRRATRAAAASDRAVFPRSPNSGARHSASYLTRALGRPRDLARRLSAPPHLLRPRCSTGSTCCRSASTSSASRPAASRGDPRAARARRRRAHVRRPPRQLRGAAHDRRTRRACASR